MNKTIVILAALASTTLFASAASAHGRGSNTAHTASSPALAVGLGAKVGGRSGLLSVGAGVHTPVANVGLGVQAASHGQLLSLDLGAFNGGVGR